MHKSDSKCMVYLEAGFVGSNKAVIKFDQMFTALYLYL